MLRLIRLALLRAGYVLVVTMVAIVAVGALATLTASSMTDAECRPWSGLEHCRPIVQMFQFEQTHTHAPSVVRTADESR